MHRTNVVLPDSSIDSPNLNQYSTIQCASFQSPQEQFISYQLLLKSARTDGRVVKALALGLSKPNSLVRKSVGVSQSFDFSHPTLY